MPAFLAIQGRIFGAFMVVFLFMLLLLLQRGGGHLSL